MTKPFNSTSEDFQLIKTAIDIINVIYDDYKSNVFRQHSSTQAVLRLKC